MLGKMSYMLLSAMSHVMLKVLKRPELLPHQKTFLEFESAAFLDYIL